MKKLLSSLLMLTAVSLTVFAQGMPDAQTPQGENLNVPVGWEIRTDQPMENMVVSADPEAGDMYFVNMTPGWHITTGPRAIFWHPEFEVSGDYNLHTTLHLFNPEGRNREGYGLFFGGDDLKGDGQEYVYFLLRNTGDFLIKKRMGDETSVIKDWTASEAITIYEDESVSSVTNELTVSVSDGMMTFSINGTQVHTQETGDLKTGGTFGLRVNHAVNLHVSDLGVSEM